MGWPTDRRAACGCIAAKKKKTGVIEGFTDARPPVLVEPVLESPIACPKPGFGVDAAGEDFYVDHELLTGEGECPAVVEREKAEEKEPAEGVYARPVRRGEAERRGTAGRGDESADRRARPAEHRRGRGRPGQRRSDARWARRRRGMCMSITAARCRCSTAAARWCRRFGAGELKDGMGVAVDSKTGDVFVVDGASDKVECSSPNRRPGRSWKTSRRRT